MGRRPWTTRRQKLWLENRRRDYQDTQDTRRLTEFYADISADFFTTFGLRIGIPKNSGLEDRMGEYDGDSDEWSDESAEDTCYAESEKQARNVSLFQ